MGVCVYNHACVSIIPSKVSFFSLYFTQVGTLHKSKEAGGSFAAICYSLFFSEEAYGVASLMDFSGSICFSGYI